MNWQKNPGRWLLASLKMRSAAISRTALKRCVALWMLIAIVMALPILQLFLSRGEAPLASSYPNTLEGWSVGEKMVPALPFVHVPSLDVYGPLPELSHLSPEDANTATNPFLIWRVAVNMNRQRLIMFNLNEYISDPSLMLEPVYLLALLLLPLLFWNLRRDIGAQFAVSVSLAILFVMFNPFLTPLIGSLVMPWILWRFVWLFPYALIIALATHRIIKAVAGKVMAWFEPKGVTLAQNYASAGFIIILTLAFSPAIVRNIQDLNFRETSPFFYPTPEKILSYLSDNTAQTGPATVLADSSLSVTLPAYVANAAVVAHRAPTTSEVFPANRQDEALQRLIDQDYFFNTPYLTKNGVDIINRYQTDYIVAPSGSDMEMQLRLAPQWFQWLMDDQSYSLYRVVQPPAPSQSILGNTALLNGEWESAQTHYQQALSENPSDLLALIGLAEIDHAHGRFDEAINRLAEANAQIELAAIHHRLGEIYAEQGNNALSIAEFETAQKFAPQVSRFHAALGNACLSAGNTLCAAEQFAAAAASQNHPDDASRLLAQGDLWRQQGQLEQAISLYEQAVQAKPSSFNRFVLESAYRQAGQFQKSEALINTLWTEHPLSEETISLRAGLLADEGKINSAIAQYRRLLLLQNLRTQNTVNTHIALAQLLLENNRLELAEKEIETIIKLEPYNAAGYRLQGDLFSAQGQLQDSIYAYLNAFELDPTQIGVYLSLSNQLRLFGGQDERILELLQTAVEINPAEPTLFLALGDELEQRGQAQAAIEAYQTALNRFDTGALLPQQRGRSNEQSIAFAQTRLGRAYEELGAQTQALNHYQAAVSAVPEAGWAWVMLGDAHRRANNFNRAAAAYQQAIAKDPAFINAYISLAEMAIEEKEFETAEGYLQQAINADSQNERPYIRLGDVAELRGDYQQALSWYSQAASLAPTDETVNIALIDSLLRYGGYNTALKYVEQALQTQYGNSNLMLRQSRIQRALGQDDTAEETLIAATEINANDVQLHTELADFYVEKGQPQQAIETYLKGIERLPTEPGYYTGISAILLTQAQPAEALAILQDGLSNAPGAEEVYIAMARLHQRQGNPELALAVLEKGLATAGDTVNIRLALANYYTAQAKFDEAGAQLALALDLGTDPAAVNSALANLAVQRGKAQDALTFHRQALAFQADNPAYLLALGNTYQQLERFDEAIAAYQLAIQTEPGLANAYIALANAYTAQEQWDDARQTYEQGLTETPNNVDLLAQYGQFLLEQGAQESALSLLERARQTPNTVNNRLGRASLYQTLQLYPEAQSELESVLQQEPGNLNALLALGDLYLVQENYADAERAYQLAVDLAPGSPVGYLRLGRLASQQNDLTTAQDYADTARAVEPGAFGGN